MVTEEWNPAVRARSWIQLLWPKKLKLAIIKLLSLTCCRPKPYQVVFLKKYIMNSTKYLTQLCGFKLTICIWNWILSRSKCNLPGQNTIFCSCVIWAIPNFSIEFSLLDSVVCQEKKLSLMKKFDKKPFLMDALRVFPLQPSAPSPLILLLPRRSKE